MFFSRKLLFRIPSESDVESNATEPFQFKRGAKQTYGNREGGGWRMSVSDVRCHVIMTNQLTSLCLLSR